MRNLAEDPAHANVLEELRERLSAWMQETEDPLLDGPVPVPPGAVVNDPGQSSPNDPLTHRQHAYSRLLRSVGVQYPGSGLMGVIRRLRLSFWIAVIGTVVLYVFFVVLATISPGQVAALTVVIVALAAIFTIRNVRVAARARRSRGNPQLRRSRNRIRERRGF